MKMSKTVKVFFLAALASIAAPLVASAANGGYYNSSLDNDGSFYNTWIKHRLSAGLSFSYMGLTDAERNKSHTFLGNITKLKLDDEFMVVPDIKYDLCDYLQLGISYSYMKIGTYNWNNGLGDGYARMQGPTVRLEFEYPMCEYRFFPHLGFGVAFLNCEFVEDANWRLGYSNYEAWAARGFTSRTAFGKFRDIEIDDVVAPMWTVGASYRLHPNLELDLSFRMMYADPDCEFGYINGRGVFGRQASGDFEINNYSILFTTSYVF